MLTNYVCSVQYKFPKFVGDVHHPSPAMDFRHLPAIHLNYSQNLEDLPQMSEAIRFDLITQLSLNVEAHHIHCLSTKVDVYTENVTVAKCIFSPFRTFDRRLD